VKIRRQERKNPLKKLFHLIVINMRDSGLEKFLLIVLILFIPLITGAKEGCRKSDKACRVSKEDAVSHEEGIFLGISADIPVVLPQNLADSTGSVVSGIGLSVSTAIGGLTGIPATTHLKLEKSKPAELNSDFNKKNLPGMGTLAPYSAKDSHPGREGHLASWAGWDGGAKAPQGVPGMDKMFILLVAVLFVLIILVYLRHRFHSQK
jgi:uncharacterized membrane protein